MNIEIMKTIINNEAQLLLNQIKEYNGDESVLRKEHEIILEHLPDCYQNNFGDTLDVINASIDDVYYENELLFNLTNHYSDPTVIKVSSNCDSSFFYADCKGSIYVNGANKQLTFDGLKHMVEKFELFITHMDLICHTIQPPTLYDYPKPGTDCILNLPSAVPVVEIKKVELTKELEFKLSNYGAC